MNVIEIEIALIVDQIGPSGTSICGLPKLSSVCRGVITIQGLRAKLVLDRSICRLDDTELMRNLEDFAVPTRILSARIVRWPLASGEIAHIL
jgi:hypothetical protein